MLPKYLKTRIYAACWSRRPRAGQPARAMKAATDNAKQLIERLTRQANQARQAQITQEITEIVGGAAALAGHPGTEDD